MRLDRSGGLVWHFEVKELKMEPHHVRFEKAVSECGSESSWFSYVSSSGMNPSQPLGSLAVTVTHFLVLKPF